MAGQSSDHRPSKEEIAAAAGKTVPDVIAPGLAVLFCGINPSLYTAAVGHHFARPGNRFWPTLLAAGFTDRLLSPFEEHELLERGLGITNLVARATASAAELSSEELQQGRMLLEKKLRRYRPGILAILGLGAYRRAFNAPSARPGPQLNPIDGTAIWALPNPSGLNANYTPSQLARLYGELREALSDN